MSGSETMNERREEGEEDEEVHGVMGRGARGSGEQSREEPGGSPPASERSEWSLRPDRRGADRSRGSAE